MITVQEARKAASSAYMNGNDRHGAIIDALANQVEEQRKLLEHALGAWDSTCSAFGWERDRLNQFAAVRKYLESTK